MAGSSQKKQAVSNIQSLKEIHTLSLVINLVTLIVLFSFNRPSSKKIFIIFTIPLLICEYIIEKTGRPKYDSSGKLVSSGEDLKQSGLTEYMFDIIYFTLICDILMIVFGSNKVWYLYLAIPGFASYKLFGLIKAGRALLGGGSSKTENSTEEQTPAKSKRQAKLEARGNRQRVQAR
ncbi:hypothetical protein PACTADRAFT_48776 [Pachysolen tannophilus NRRL Y-2460]|uniref:DUF788-domain-containing protein n=1 Tax=Pachysolen tannophilus NRRL Y-2460 TaxID=669874 RepID=A0A1E4TZ35_PACTA|nr:hypothetical protein PACTADRAFT_48776 [Pachysolen tannophilus NRRL Y-2460]